MDTDPGKLKVVELRQELSQRGLDSRGNKAALVDRLRKALEEETGQALPNTSIDTSAEESTDYTQNTTAYESALEESQQDQEDEQMQSDDYYQQQQGQYDQDGEDNSQQYNQDDSSYQQDENSMSQQYQEQSQQDGDQQINDQSSFYNDDSAQQKDEEQEGADYKQKVKEKYGFEMDVQDIKQENADVKQEGDKENIKQEIKQEPGTEVKEEKDRHGDSRKRKHSPSPQRKSPIPRARREIEPEFDENAVLLSWYDSDLNFIIDKDTGFTKGVPLYKDGFGYIWAGVRATFGFIKGKIVFEVKVTENCDVSHLEDEPNPNVLRVGWSVLTTSMQLGEEPLSYGYGGTGKISTNCKFKDYGKPFVVGDVVTAYLDYESSPGHAIISYGVNGEDLGVAYDIDVTELEGKALFPHMLSKNVGFDVNFGTLETPWFEPQAGFTWASQVPLEDRVSGPKRPTKKGDCEAIMMCGLPGCGKTTWANEYAAQHPDKFFNILGTNNLIDKMKLMGLPRKRNYAGRWDVLIDKSTKCLNKLLQEAYMRRRNYIIDQTNVYPSAQKRKMRNYDGFVRRAVVIVPTDEEFKRRVAKREAEEGKDVPDSAVLEMKANFKLPEKGDIFSDVTYVELDETEARKLVEKYNKEAKDAGFGQQQQKQLSQKRFKRDDHRPFRGGGGGGYRGGHRGGKGFDRRDRHNGKPPFRRGGPPPLMRGSRGMDRQRGPPGGGGGGGGGDRGWQPRGPGGGGGGGGDRWRDRNQGGGGGGGGRYGNDRGPNMGGWRGGGGPGGRMGGGGGGGGGGRNDYGDRPGGRMGGGGGGGGGGGYNDRNRGPPPQHNRNRDNKKVGGGGGGGGSRGGDGSSGGGGGGGSGPPALPTGGNQNQGGQQGGGQQGGSSWSGYAQGGQQGGWGWGQQANYGQGWGQNYQQTQQQQQQQIGGYGQGGYGQQPQQQQTGYNQTYSQGYANNQNPYANWQQQQQYYNQQYGQGWSQGWQGYGYGSYGTNTNTSQQTQQVAQQQMGK